ncbi:MAG: HD domain-containing protein [Alphaproteobacteria bacterium]|nr:HD domain-containing protein [Alphaproteobacteria bacterium]
MTPFLKDSCKILQKKIKECKRIVHDDDFCRFYCQEKEQHSFQVLSAGEYILKKLPDSFDEEKKNLYLSGALLHDIGRFKEIRFLLKDKSLKYDHGRLGKEELEDLGIGDKIFHLAVLHHGHQLDDFYKDTDYLVLDDEDKKSAEALLFFIRDSDKIANLKLFVDRPDIGKMDEVYFPRTGKIAEEVVKSYQQMRCSDYRLLKGVEDWFFARVSWIFELHYHPSFEFIRQYDLIRRHLDFMKDYTDDLNFLKFCEEQLNTYIEKQESR